MFREINKLQNAVIVYESIIKRGIQDNVVIPRGSLVIFPSNNNVVDIA